MKTEGSGRGRNAGDPGEHERGASKSYLAQIFAQRHQQVSESVIKLIGRLRSKFLCLSESERGSAWRFFIELIILVPGVKVQTGELHVRE
ncbi:hypothetical protein SAMN05443661_13336 [Natronobacterium gregoryi]|uniref:Uncharacterized protein n=2 Tax=Natronobacterium gregoryi TaxID=44930 RepID=L0AKQ4_NATGS|nr:hypothetical protein Natgr_2606 [Natronobacterium gregoryi SP2]SFJ48641.1 hypothetical protein SAMN05443661_13336 [Natronobacterium gregoryi]